MSRIVFSNGCFDAGLHPGHYDLLVQCRMFASRFGKVIVGLDSDEKVSKDKGKDRPYFTQEERKKHLLSLKYPIDSISFPLVDEVRIFNTNEELYAMIKQVGPQIIVKGRQWKNNVIGSDLAEVVLVDMMPDISTTLIESRIKASKKSSFDPNVCFK